MIKSTDYESYEEYLKENPHKFKRHEERSKSPLGEQSPAHTPRKVLSKLNSLKMSSFRSLSIQDTEDHNPDKSPEPENSHESSDLPKSQSSYSIEIPNSELLWTVDPRPDNSANFYSFTNFAMSLNEVEPYMRKPNSICKTDSRLRPDIRRLENGDLEGAVSEKARLEEKQREMRKSRKSKKGEDDWQPRYIDFVIFLFWVIELPAFFYSMSNRWFKTQHNATTKQDDWMYTGGYWDRNYDGVMDLF